MSELRKNLPGLVTEDEAIASRHCPFNGSSCWGSRCMLFRFVREHDRKTYKRLAFCGAGGVKGAWSRVPVWRNKSETAAVRQLPQREPAHVVDEDTI